MDRVFLDANVLYSAAYLPKSRLRELWEMAEVELLISPYALEEVRRNLALDRPERLPDLDKLVGKMTITPEPEPNQPLPPGVDLVEKDRPILVAAIQAKVTHLLTGDKDHFAKLFGRLVAGVLILPPNQYFENRS